MKKVFLFFAVVATTLAFASCGNKAADNKTTDEDSTVVAAPAPEVVDSAAIVSDSLATDSVE